MYSEAQVLTVNRNVAWSSSLFFSVMFIAILQGKKSLKS
jgi:hypothetical protein